jgi:hypothetical protein
MAMKFGQGLGLPTQITRLHFPLRAFAFLGGGLFISMSMKSLLPRTATFRTLSLPFLRGMARLPVIPAKLPEVFMVSVWAHG